MGQPLDIIYTIFLGLLFVTFVRVGISTFVTKPRPWSEERPTIEPGRSYADLTEAEKLRHEDNVKAFTTRRIHEALLRRNRMAGLDSAWSTALAAALMAVGLLLSSRIGILGNGIILGGVLTLLGAVFVGLASDRTVRFVVVSVSLVLTLLLGYLKFVLHI